MVTLTETECKVIKPDQVIENLIAYRDSLASKKDPRDLEVFWKINSCLYGTYPKNKG